MKDPELTKLLARAKAIVPMREIADGLCDPLVVGMRHDVDDHGYPNCRSLAQWEATRGYRSSYYILHTAWYWRAPGLRRSLAQAVEQGHEIGMHTNALAESLRTGVDPDVILDRALQKLRGWGFEIRGIVGHGDNDCYFPNGVCQFVNDEQFLECARPDMGAPDRTLTLGGRSLKLKPRSIRDFGLDYLPNWLSRTLYLSDSGGTWRPPLKLISLRFPASGQLHVLWHPDWL